MKPGLSFRPLLPFAALAALLPSSAFAACTSPPGNEGDIVYSSIQHLMVYCNSASWIAMGSSPPINFGTLTTNYFCTATSGTAIQCTTPSTGSGNVVLATAPVLSSPTISSGGLAITAGGLTVSADGANITGTVTGTTFSGSGASLTNIGTTNLTAISGTPTGTTYLRGDGTWGIPSLPTLINTKIWVGDATNTAIPVAMSGDCGLANSGAITCTKTNGTSFAASATTDTTNASNISSGTVGTARLGTGTADNTTYLRGDNTWATPASGSSNACAGGTNPQVFNGHCYTSFQTRTTDWTSARAMCQAWGGDLVIINDTSENAFLATNYAAQSPWIGLTDQTTEATFKWWDNSTPSYTNFNAVTGNSQANDFVFMNTDGTWKVTNSLTSKKFICESNTAYSGAAAQNMCSGEKFTGEFNFAGIPACNSTVQDTQCFNGALILLGSRSGGNCDAGGGS